MHHTGYGTSAHKLSVMVLLFNLDNITSYHCYSMAERRSQENHRLSIEIPRNATNEHVQLTTIGR